MSFSMHSMAGGAGRRVDPDHGRGGIDDARRSEGASSPAWLPTGTPFPDGVGGARSNGSGHVLRDPDVVAAAQSRAATSIDAATPGIPQLDAAGSLPRGVHTASLEEFADRFVTNDRRAELMGQLRPVLDALNGVGVPNLIVGGSFVTSKPHPGDLDVAYPSSDAAAVTQARAALRALEGAAPEVHAYPAGELLVEAPTLKGVTPGINVLEFLQRSREGDPRGVVLLATAADG
jgi:hypothetical protein